MFKLDHPFTSETANGLVVIDTGVMLEVLQLGKELMLRVTHVRTPTLISI